MPVVFVSPHLDDIALSCGGFVHRLASRGQRVVILTVCTADAPESWPLSAAAQHVHWEWQLGAGPYACRRAEDERACASLGAQAIHLGLLDAVYRLDEAGRPLYSRDFIGVAPHPLDRRRHTPAVARALISALSAFPSTTRVFAPLAVGGHVDHSLVRSAIERAVPAARLRYYEDFPYASWDASRLVAAYGLAAKTRGLRPSRVRLRPAEVDARVAAVGCYASQLFALFGRAQDMPNRVREYISCVQGERYWRR